MIEKSQETKTVTVTTYVCDSCGKKTKVEGKFKKCPMCGKLFCPDCLVLFDWDILKENSWYTDYPDYMCRDCWNKGKKYREKIIDLRKECEEKEDQLLKEWKGAVK